MTDSNPVYDHIIVGAGTAGCLLANRLSANPAKRVLLIEAGGNDDYLWVHIPVGYLYCIGNPRTDWLYSTEPDPGLNGRRLRYPRGKVLGGCSSINGMIYMRGQSRDYDSWAEATGDARWRWEHSLPYFKQHEDHWRGADGHHAAPGFDATGDRAGGEWRVEKQRLSWEILDAFAAAAQEAGIPATDDFNRGSNEGVGYFEVNQRRGVRWSATKAFLRPIQHRANLQVWTGAQVTRLITARDEQGLRVTGVEVRPEGHDHNRGAPLIARLADGGELVMAAGAVGTPQILQLSGIGPAALLQQHGISVQQDLAGVGQNLQDHLQIRAVFEVQGVKTLNTMANSLWGKGLIGLEYLLRRSGPMSMAPSQLGAAPLQRFHRQRVQPQPELTRPGADPLISARGCAGDHGQLPVDRAGPQDCRRVAALDPTYRCPAGAGEVPTARSQARHGIPERRRTGAAGR